MSVCEIVESENSFLIEVINNLTNSLLCSQNDLIMIRHVGQLIVPPTVPVWSQRLELGMPRLA